MRRRAGIALAAALVAAGCRGRQGPVGENGERANIAADHLATIDLRGGLPERGSASLFGDAAGDSFADFVLELRDVAADPRARGLYVSFGSAAVPLARAEEAGALLAALRADGRAITCHADDYGNATMMLAARACSEIWVSPAGGVDTVGLAAQLMFGKSLLERLKIDVDFLQEGKFKGAKEPFVRDEASPEARASLQSTLVSLRESWREAVGVGRGRDGGHADPEALGLEDGPHAPEAARALGLVDRVGFADEARRAALEGLGLDNAVVRFGGGGEGPSGVARILRYFTSSGDEARGPHVALVRATGAIASGGGGALFGDGGISERQLGRLLRRLRDDPRARAVVLRIDSPGGSALASDLLWHELMELRKAKPLVVSVGGMAASGGYYLASAGTQIFADETSILGSIGVVAGKLSFARSLAYVGVNVEAVPAREGGAARALYASPFTAWDDATRAKVSAGMAAIYDLFKQRIIEARGIAPERLDASAEGRIMSGRDAVASGLADTLGGLDAALSRAYELAELDVRAPVRIVDAPSGLLAALGLQARAADERTDAAAELEGAADRAVRRALLAPLAPYAAEVEPYLASLAPLVEEHYATALPYGFILR